MFQNTVHGECIYGNLLNGEWVESEFRKQLEIHSPVDGRLDWENSGDDKARGR